jgi:glyoxylase-like metal-dependent hydrolase (beta-lactamase superfamily II)
MPRITRLVADNQSALTGPGTNTYIVANRWCLIIDPGPATNTHFNAILRVAERYKRHMVLLTHNHIDHSESADKLASVLKCKIAAFIDSEHQKDIGLSDGQAIPEIDFEVKCLHTPGHAQDHICFYIPELEVLFSGDLIVGQGTTVLEPQSRTSLKDFLNSLEKISKLALTVIYPGHWDPIHKPLQAISELINHRKLRNEQILDAIKKGCSTLSEIVSSVYADTPEHLYPFAEMTVTAHLYYLIDTGLVSADNGKFSLKNN